MSLKEQELPQEGEQAPSDETPKELSPEDVGASPTIKAEVQEETPPAAEPPISGRPADGRAIAAPPAKRKKKKLPPGDDGRTIAEMNVEGMPWYNPTMGKVKEEDKPTRKERRAMIGAGYLAYLPAFLMVLLGFTAAVLIIYLWLHGWTF